jgi:microcystin-dependent protein
MTGPLILSRNAELPLEATTLQQVNVALGANFNYMPAGAVQLFAMSAIPTGWLECNGAAVSRTTYANLFAVIGTTYGAGDGSITFNLPDMRGQFARGWDHGRGVDPGRTLGSLQGPANQAHAHNLTVTNPAHNHTIADYGHSHGISDPGHSHAGTSFLPGAAVAASDQAQFYAIGAIPSATTGITVNAAVANLTNIQASQATTVVMDQQGTEARPTNIAMVYCIRAYGALQTDGLGSMAFQNKDAVDITGGAGVFTTLQCTTAPTQPNDVARLADIGVGVLDLFSANPEVLLVDKTNPQNPILRPQVNVPNGTVQLDALGYVPSSVLNITDLTFLGTFSALPGTLPVGTFATGDYYQIDTAGTLTLNTSAGDVATPCNVGDQIIYNAATPGWWYSPASVASSLPATAITFAPGGTIAATNVQVAISELDSETQAALALKANTANVLPLTGGTLSGALTVQTVKISGSGSLGNIGTSAEDALQIDAVAKTIKALSPYTLAGNGPTFSGTVETDVVFPASTATIIAFPNERFDLGSFYDTTTGRFTPTVPGYYQFSSSVGINCNSAKTRSVVSILKNGSTVIGTSDEVTTGRFVHSAGGLAYLNGTTDYVTLTVFAIGTTPFVNGAASPAIFSGVMVRAA